MWWVVACTSAPPAGDLPPDQSALEISTVTYVDGSRATPALAGNPGAPSRTLETRLWIGPCPGEDAPSRPLLLMAHGFDGLPEKFDAFASALASEGVVVAAPAFPATHLGNGSGVLGAGDLENQPADLTFVLDELLADVRDERSPLWRRFDPLAVVALGHSLGGATVLGWTRFDDPETRLSATAFLSPAAPLTGVFGGAPSPEGPPTLLLHGLEDETLDPQISRDLHATLDDPVWFLGLAGAGHSDPIESQDEPPIPSRAAAQAAVLALFDEAVRGRGGALDAALDRLAADGNETLP